MVGARGRRAHAAHAEASACPRIAYRFKAQCGSASRCRSSVSSNYGLARILLTAVLGAFTLATLSVHLYATEAGDAALDYRRSRSRRDAAGDRICGCARQSHREAWALFAILFLWQFPHFYSIAWLYRDDYSKAGIKMLPVVDETGERTARQILVYALILVPVSLLPTYFGMSGNLYLIGATLLSFTYLYYGFRIASERTRFAARKVLLTSIVYLPLLYGLMIVDRPHL